MFEESVSSIWASMNSWFTPTVLFVLLNLMIGTIVITSSLASHKSHHQQDPQQHSQLGRSPSVLQRLSSFNFYSYRSQEATTNYFHKSPQTEQEQPTFVRSPSVIQRLKSINLYKYMAPQSEPELEPEQPRVEIGGDDDDDDQGQSIDEIYSQLKGEGHGHVRRSKSDTKPSGGEEPPARLPKKMKKSASAKSAFAHFEEVDVVEARRPATVKEGRVSEQNDGEEDDEKEVDARADDFINKFKQQLKLQRLNSILRYKEMIGRGAGK